jgi:phosphoglycerate dehydrogenase-like enzyme
MREPSPPRAVLVASYLEPEYVEQISRVPGIRVIYDPDLLPRPRYTSDHVGTPLRRTEEQERRWRECLAQAEVMFDFDRTNAKALRELIPNVRWIQATSTGIGDLLVRTGLIHTSILFTTARGIHAKPLADFAVMAMLWFAKEGFRMIRRQAAHRWERYCGREVRGATVGIVGLGTIGREVARLSRALGMTVIGTKRTAPAPATGEGDVDLVLPLADLPTLLRAADYLVLAVPRTPHTDRLIGKREFEALKPGAVLVNIARGAVVDEAALIEALRTGRLAGAALDVLAKEPPDDTNPLWDLPNVLISPHSASTVDTENARITALFCENLTRFLEGQPLLNVFDRDRLY